MFNNKTKTFLLLTLIFVTLLGVSAATAATIDNNATDTTSITQDTTTQAVNTASDNNIQSASNKEINKKTVEQEVKTEGEGTFADLTTDITASEVTLTKDYIQGSGEQSINITEDKTIDGNGYTITTDNGTFTVNSGVTLTLKNSIIKATWGPDYNNYVSTIYNKGTVILENVTFNYVPLNRTYGSYVYMDANSNLTVKDSVFDGGDSNRAFIYGYGANIDMNIDNSLFANYNLSNSGIYMSKVGNLTLTNTNFTNGTGSSYGGALYLNHVNQLLLIDNCRFENLSPNYRGGAMYISGKSTIKNSLFKDLKNMQSTYNAGAIWLNSNADLYLENNTMENVQSTSSDIYLNNGKINSTVKLVGENVTVNQEDEATISFVLTDDMGNTLSHRLLSASATINEESYSLTNYNTSLSTSFTASEIGTFPITVDIPDTYFTGTIEQPEDVNLIVNDIGLLHYSDVQAKIDAAIAGDTITIDGPVFRGSNEDCINIPNKNINIDFAGNIINAKNGRVFNFNESHKKVTISNAIVTGIGNPSPSTTNTEGRFAYLNDSKVTFNGINFKDNNAPCLGSSAKSSFILAFASEPDTYYLNLDNCVIDNCTGTFINNIKYNIYLTNDVFRNNKLPTSTWGAFNSAIIANGGYTELTDCEFANNTVGFAVVDDRSQDLSATGYGSSFITTNIGLEVNNCSFINNNAPSGKGAAIHTSNDTLITDSTFINNYNAQYNNKGGAIGSDDGLLDIDNCIFVNNSARYSVSSYSSSINEGSAIYNAKGDLNIKNSIIISNVTQVSAVYNDASDATIVANGNYWGTNNPEGFYKSSSSADEITVDNWVVFNVTIDTTLSEIMYKDVITAKATLNTLNDGTQLTTNLPDYGSVTFSSTTGSFDTETADMVDGVATAQFTVNNSPFTITATYPNTEAEYTGEAAMPEPQVYVLNDGNWTAYFNEDLTVNDNLVVPNSELRFEGEFNNRNMIINIPLNLTTADTQAVLNNCTIYVNAENVNITKLEMVSDDQEDALITINNSANTRIEENKLTLTNNGDKVFTHSIDVINGDNSLIKANIITTTGPEDAITYGGYGLDIVVRLYTTGIYANLTGAQGLIIDSNNITTKKNSLESETLGTIYGIFVFADRDEPSTGVQVINNNITAQSDVYVYAIDINDQEGALIENNTVTAIGQHYAAGIQLNTATESIVNNNTINATATNQTYGVILSGIYGKVGSGYYDYELYLVEDNKVTNNKVSLKSKQAWGIEVFDGEVNDVTDNTIDIDADNAVGVAIGGASYTTIDSNNITINATMVEEEGSFDKVSALTAGVKIVSSTDHGATDTEVTNNRITVNAPESTVPAVNSTTNRNVVTDNFLISPLGFGDDAVVNTAYSITVKDNTPDLVITDETYSDYFDDDMVLKPLFNNTDLIVSGDITGKVFIFDGVNVTITNDGTATLYDSQIMTGNGATVVFDGLVIVNSFDAIVFESSGNVINNSIITINSEDAVHPIAIYEDNNIIANTVVNVVAPSGDVEYNADYSTKTPAPAAILVSSSNNILDNVTVTFNATTTTGDYPTVNGIHIGSVSALITNNSVSNSKVTVDAVGPKTYAYGINVGNAKDTTLDNINVDVTSEYYADAIQLFDADNLTATGNVKSKAGYEAYGIYSTAMGTGYSQNIDVSGLNVVVEAPKATGALFEGTKNIKIADATYTVTGEQATAINSHVDWMGNIPSNITITGLDITIDTTGDANVLYFGNASDVTITDNRIVANAGGPINFNVTPKATVTDNYIEIGEMLETGIFGNYAVITTEEDTVVENNTPTSKVIDDLNDEIDELENKTDALEDKLSELEEKLAQLAEQLEQVAQQNAQQQQQINDMNNTINNQTEQINDMNNTINNQAGQISDMNNTINNQTEQINDMNKTINEQATQIDDMNSTINEQATQIDDLNKTINEQAEQIDELNNTVEELQDVVDAQDDTINDLTDVIKDQDQTISNLTDALEKTTDNLNDLNNEVEDLNSQINDQKETIDELNSTIGELEKTIEEQNKTIEDLNNTVEELQDVVDAQDETISDLTDVIKDQEETISDLTDNVDELTSQVEDLSKAKATTITLDTINTTKYNEEVTISGMLVTEDDLSLNNQEVVISINGEEVNVKTVNGVFTHTFTAKKIGENVVTATFAGNDKYTTSTTQTTFYVQKKPVLYFYATENTTEDNTVTVSGKLLNNGKAISGATVTLNVNGEDVTVTPNKDGYFKYSFTAIAGENVVTATYAGTTEYAEATATTSVHAMMKTTLYAYKIENANTQDTIKVSGKLLNKGKGVQGQTVTIKVNGKTYTATTNKEGFFQYDLKVTSAGVNNLTVTFDGNEDYLAAQYNSTFTTKNKAKVYTYKLADTKVGKSSKISGKLLSNNEPLADKEVTVTVNGEKFTATTNVEGYFQLSYVPKSAGTFNVVVTYPGDDEYLTASYNTTIKVEA